MSRLKETLTEAYHTIRCAGGWAFLAAETTAFATPAVAFSLLNDNGKTSHKVGRAWARFNLRIMNADIHVSGLEKLSPGQPYVVMTNHQSHLDVWVVTAVLPLQLRWVMKQELRRIPVFGYACERMGHIYVKRGVSESAKASMKEAARKIAEGTSVVFFPEGTRSRTGELGPFKTGGFRLAIQADAPILPIGISGTRKMLAPDTWKFYSGRVQVNIADPIAVDGLTLDDLDHLMEKTRKAIRAELSGTG